MKFIVSILLAVSLLAGSALASIPKPILDFYQSNVWLVHNDQFSGTAWNLSPTLLITNRHVIQGEEGAWFVTKEGLLNELPVTILAVNPVYDMAIHKAGHSLCHP